MANLTRTNWPKGWSPSEDAIDGDPNGLLRMDNLTIDKTGVIGLVDGQKRLVTLTDNIGQIFSRNINGTEYFWVATGSSCRRYTGTFSGGVDMQVAGAGSIGTQGFTAFGDALGQILVTNGAMRTKDSVKSAPLPLGLLTPINGQNGPSGQVNIQQPTLTFPSNYNILLGSPVSIIFTIQAFKQGVSPDPTTQQIIIAPPLFSINTINIGGGGPAPDISQDIIQLPFDIPFNPISTVIDVGIYFLLDGDPTDQTTWQNYYFFDFNQDNIASQIQPGSTATVLSVSRGDFFRSGNNSQLDWTNVIGAVILANTSVALPTLVFGAISIIGGITGQLNGVYSYIQVNVNNNGVYLAKSPTSPLAINSLNGSTNFSVINGSVTLTPIKNDPQANEYWFFRKAATEDGNNSTLSNWNFVGKSTGAIFQDTLSDTSVLQLNIDQSLQPNLYLKSLRFDDTNGLQTTLFGVEGLFNERILYFDLSFIYLSAQLNPDAIDTRYILRPSGDSSEQNLWLKRLTNNVLILGTTKGLYEISGTLLVAPDGTIDANIISLGEAYPPLTPDVCNWNGGLYYVAADGLRVTTGSNSVNLSPALRHLFTTQSIQGITNSARHGISVVQLYIGIGYHNYIVAAHQKVLFLVQLQDQSRRIIVYDTVSQTYSIRDFNPTGLFLTHAGELLVAYGGDLHIMDYQPGFGFNNQTGLPFTLRTVFDANGQPRNRKDIFTLKLVADTGGASVSVALQKDGVGVTETDETSYLSLGTFALSGAGTVYFPLNIDSLTLGKRYSIQIKDSAGVFTFKLYEFTIEYEPRPEQLDYQRILPINLGTISRKRWVAFAFVIDTLGNSITFTPYLDNVAWSISGIVNNATKLTYIFYFASEAIATDMGGTLSGGVFEFYGLNLEECISEKLPTPVVFLIIPSNNYGTPNRKRHTSYKYQILTRGGRVQFTPILDGQSYSPSVVNTTTKRTVEHFFSQSEGDVIGIDIGGTLASLETPQVPLEFYGTVIPQQVETLPDRLEYLRIPNENFGIAAPKRLRTLPLIIDTNGKNVLFTPIVDGVIQVGTTTLVSSGKKTLYHYFNSDVFGTDYGGILQSTAGPVSPFEFYGFGQPENVEVLPVPKKFDQLGPVRFDKIGKIFGFRIRLIMNGATVSMPYTVFGDSSPTNPGNLAAIYSGSFAVSPGYDNVYEIQFPKNINTDIFRLVLGPTPDSFHRYDVFIKVISSGMESEARWLPIR